MGQGLLQEQQAVPFSWLPPPGWPPGEAAATRLQAFVRGWRIRRRTGLCPLDREWAMQAGVSCGKVTWRRATVPQGCFSCLLWQTRNHVRSAKNLRELCLPVIQQMDAVSKARFRQENHEALQECKGPFPLQPLWRAAQ